MKKTDGYIERDYEFLQKLVKFAEEEPKLTVSILESYINYKITKSNYLSGQDVIYEALKILYENEETKWKAEKIINLLVEKGYWDFKKIVKFDTIVKSVII